MTPGLRRAAARRSTLVGIAFAITVLAPALAGASPAPMAPRDPPAYGQAQLRERLFSLITGIRRKSDITPRAVEKAVGRKMGPRQSRYVSASLAGKTREGKAYRIEIVGAPADRGLSMLIDAFRYGAADTCVLDFSRVHRDLTRLGYRASRMVDEHGPGSRWLFAKRGIYIKATYKSTKHYAPGEDVASADLCIETLTVN